MNLADRYRQRGVELAREHLHPDAVLPPQTREVAVREHRDPTAATQPVTTKHLAVGAPMISEWDAEQAVRLAFYSNVIVYRCMQILADTVAGCPFHAGPQPPSEPGAAAEHKPEARLAQLLGPPPGGPAPKLTARRLWAWSVVQRKLTGRHAWEIETSNTDEVVALWPLVSSQLKAIPSKGGAAWWDRFEYGEDPNTRKPRRLDVDNVLYGWNPSATDFRQPESCLQAARLDVSIAVMLGRYNHSFLRNDARPAAVVVTEAFASDEDFWRFKSQWSGTYGGPDNAGKIAFLETNDEDDAATRIKPSEALNVAVLGLSQKDARFIEQEKATLERVAMACGVPWSRLSAAGRTFDNAAQEDEVYWFDTVLPLVTDLGDEVNMQLADRVGREVGWFDLSHVKVFQPERKVTAVGAPALWQAQIAMLNEARSLVGLPPVDGGDRFATVEEIAALKGAQPALPPARGAASERQEEPVATSTGAAGSGVDANGTVVVVEPDPEPSTLLPVRGQNGPTHQRALTAEQQEQRRSIIWRNTDATVRTLERQWTNAMRRLFNRQQRTVISRLEGNRGRRIIEQRADAGEIFDRAHWLAETLDETIGLYEAVVGAGFARIASMFGVDFDLEAPYARRFIEARANQLAGPVTDTTYAAIRDALAAGVGEGESIPQLADRIRHVFDVATTSRAETIARTEVNSAYGGSTRLAGDQLPDDVLGGYEWISVRDQRTRDDHANADGQVIARDGSFDLGGEPCQYPGDPSLSPDNSINCRCAVAALTPAEMEGRARAPGEVAAALLGEIRMGAPIDELALRRQWRERVAS